MGDCFMGSTVWNDSNEDKQEDAPNCFASLSAVFVSDLHAIAHHLFLLAIYQMNREAKNTAGATIRYIS